MTAASAVPIRVTVLDTWDEVRLDADPGQTVGEIKAAALGQAGVAGSAEGYLVKYLGAALEDAGTLGQAGVAPNGALIVLRRRRTPVR